MKVYLIGMPGSGKSTLGAQVAHNLNIQFIDLDKEIEKREGKTVSQVFSANGEAHFRKVESETLIALSAQNDDFVMATGGGTPCYHDGIGIINTYGVSIFLDEPVSTLLKRLRGKTDRPLLLESDQEKQKEKIDSLRQSRLTCYQQATVIVQNATLSKIIAEIQLRRKSQM
jgi:shikimate kinase